MAILVDSNTRILVQGITGDFGSRHAKLSLDYSPSLSLVSRPEKAGSSLSTTVTRFPCSILLVKR